MSVASKVTLGAAVVISSAIIGYVHYKQSDDRFKLHEGVLRDIEQQQRRKHENTYTLQQQIDIAKQLRGMESTSGRENPTQNEQQSRSRLQQENEVGEGRIAGITPPQGATGSNATAQNAGTHVPDDHIEEPPEST